MSKKELLIKKVRTQFPEVKFKSVKLVTKGFDHDVLVLDNKFIFRFAKNKIYKASFIREVKFLKELAKISNLPVPNYTLLSKDQTFGGYKMIQGKELSDKLYSTFTFQQKQIIIKDLAKFLSILHNFPLKKARQMGIKKYYAQTQDPKWFYKEFWPKMQKHLTPEQQKFTRRVLLDFYETKLKYKPVVGHYDLSHDHILIGKKGKIAGIIDFGDMNISDPAYEFNGFWDFDPKLPSQIYKYYYGPKDPNFLKRSYEYYLHRWIFLLYDGKVRRKEEKLFKAASKQINILIQENGKH